MLNIYTYAKEIKQITAPEIIMRESFRHRMWIAVRAIPQSRRKLVDGIAMSIYNYEGLILCPRGLKWPMPDVYESLGDPRWVSYYKKADENGLQLHKTRDIVRLQIIDLFFQIKKPLVQRHFAK